MKYLYIRCVSLRKGPDLQTFLKSQFEVQSLTTSLLFLNPYTIISAVYTTIMERHYHDHASSYYGTLCTQNRPIQEQPPPYIEGSPAVPMSTDDEIVVNETLRWIPNSPHIKSSVPRLDAC
jgi:hypothetical protein